MHGPMKVKNLKKMLRNVAVMRYGSISKYKEERLVAYFKQLNCMHMAGLTAFITASPDCNSN
jgi:hypothetical protein